MWGFWHGTIFDCTRCSGRHVCSFPGFCTYTCGAKPQNADDSLLAVGTNKGDVYVVDVTERVVLVCLTDHSKPVRTVYFAPPTTSYADHLFVGSDDRIVSVHDVRYVRESLQASTITSLQGHTGWILDVQSGGDGRIVASR